MNISLWFVVTHRTEAYIFNEMLSIKEQYEHPLWRRKTSEILERDDYTCRCCNSNDKQLHVHHVFYEKDVHIWEYDNESLVTLCKDCHKIIHTELNKVSGIIAFEILCGNIDVIDFLNHLSKKYGKR